MPNRIILTAAALMLFSFPAFADDSGIPPKDACVPTFAELPWTFPQPKSAMPKNTKTPPTLI